MTSWTLDPDDFAVHWYSDAVDRFPRPLHYLSRFMYQEDFDNHRNTLLDSCSRLDLDSIRATLDVATTATWRIEISGSTTKTRDNTTAEYRIHATHNGFQSVVLDQIIRNGNDGPISVHVGRAESLPQRLISYLPKQAPGTLPATSFATRDITPRHDTYLEDVAYNSPNERYRRFINRPSHGGGSAALYRGSILDRSTPQHSLEWRDFTDDGRYTMTRDPHEVTFSPASMSSQGATISKWITSEARFNGSNDNEWPQC
ncbi:ESX secretion-associated protein EspG [Nocardia sp. NPDC059177]|uniref:ESX secretion-associated protein EspG n=1 Tax=Nocardia sp. NPDC059177 TaxID=3346759 RepID=UPI003681907F